MYYFLHENSNKSFGKLSSKSNFWKKNGFCPSVLSDMDTTSTSLILICLPIFGIIKKASMLLIGIFHMFAKRESLKAVN